MPKADHAKFRTANKYGGKKRQKKFYGQSKKNSEETAVVSSRCPKCVPFQQVSLTVTIIIHAYIPKQPESACIICDLVVLSSKYQGPD